MRKRIAILFILLLPVLPILMNLDKFAFPLHSSYSDLLISHFPNIEFIRNTMLTWGIIPLWSEQILSGYPFAANPLSGIWYLPGWIAVLFQGPLGVNLTISIHAIFGGIGIYSLSRSEGNNVTSSLVGTIVFEAMPKLFSHYAAGHISLYYAVSWTPWLLYLSRQYHATGLRRRWLETAAVLGVIILADVRWAVYAFLAWGLSEILLVSGKHTRCKKQNGKKGEDNIGRMDMMKGGIIRWATVIMQVFVGILIATTLLLPLTEYSRLSTRWGLSLEQSTIFSLPWEKLLGLIAPNFGEYAEWVVYPGALGVIALIWTISGQRLRKSQLYWLILCITPFVYAMGANLPALHGLFLLPGLSLLRVPPRIIFLSGIGFAILVSAVMNSWIDRQKLDPDRAKAVLIVFGLASFSWIMALGSWFITDEFPKAFGWGALMMTGFLGLYLLLQYKKIPVRIFSWLIILLVMIDLLVVNFNSIKYLDSDTVYADGQRVTDVLAQDGGVFRVYSPSYSVPQHNAERSGIFLADGVDPLQLRVYSDFMASATGVPSTGYSVSIPNYSSGRPSEDNSQYQPSARLLGLLNVRYIVSAYELYNCDFQLLNHNKQAWVYKNLREMPRSWVQPEENEIGIGISEIPEIVELEPNRITLNASGPGLLVLSEIYYPGWHVFVDGEEKHIEGAMGILRSVILPRGYHEVEFLYRPRLVYIGILFSSITWIGLIGFWILAGKRAKTVCDNDAE
jgi:hypothetical protein